MERVVRLVKHLLVLLKMKRLIPHHYLTLDLEAVDEHLHLLFRTNQALQPADSDRILLACVDGEFDGGHIALRDPIEAVQVLQQSLLDLFDGSGMVQFFLNHLVSAE